VIALAPLLPVLNRFAADRGAALSVGDERAGVSVQGRGDVVGRRFEDGEQGTSPWTTPALGPDRVPRRFRVHVITAMYSSADERRTCLP